MDPELEKMMIFSDDSDSSANDFDDSSIIEDIPKFPDELIIGVIGNVDSGKSTTVGVLVNEELDDGRGLARSKVLQFAHENRSGRTSSVTSTYIRTETKIVEFVDLPGHRKYLRTTMYGLAGRKPDYALIMVGANMVLSRQTQEHLEIVLSLGIPFMIIMTKVDIAPPNVLKDNHKNLVKMIKKSSTKQTLMTTYKKRMTIDDIASVAEHMAQSTHRLCPIILISNKQGHNVDALREIIMKLPPRFAIEPNTSDQLFTVGRRYRVNGVGTVVSGRVTKGSIKVGDKLYVGPVGGNWIQIIVKSIHNNFREVVNELFSGQSGCLAIKSVQKKIKLNDLSFRKGVILANYQKMTWEFIADAVVLKTNDTTMQVGYKPVLNCTTVVQAACIEEIIESPTPELIRGGENAVIRFRFCFRPEHVNVGDRFIFREGLTKGLGIIQKLV